MCEHRESRRIKIRGRTIRVDGCLAGIIKNLNEMGIKTVASCCGHGRYPSVILVETKWMRKRGPNYFEEQIIIRDLYSGKIIPRARNFFKMDSNGYYYLPEATEDIRLSSIDRCPECKVRRPKLKDCDNCPRNGGREYWTHFRRQFVAEAME